jgi:hypothetical protein
MAIFQFVEISFSLRCGDGEKCCVFRRVYVQPFSDGQIKAVLQRRYQIFPEKRLQLLQDMRFIIWMTHVLGSM